VTLRKSTPTTAAVFIGLAVFVLLFLGMRRGSVRVSQREREAILRTDLRRKIREADDACE